MRVEHRQAMHAVMPAHFIREGKHLLAKRG
jgi:hypothetical protein